MMAVGPKNEELNSVRRLKSLLANLIDSVVYAERASEESKNVEELKALISKKLAKVDKLKNNVSTILKEYSEEEKSIIFKPTDEQIMEFTSAALEQFKERLRNSINDEIAEKKSEMNSNKTKAAKSIEIFLLRDPLPVTERKIILKGVEGGYDARARYRCENEIEYEFTLNTKEVELLHDSLSFSGIEKGMKIPVKIAGTWATKEAAVDYEKMERYILQSAEFSENHLLSVFKDPRKDSEFKFVYSVSDRESAVHVEFKTPAEVLDVTTQPSLSKNLDMDKLRSSMKTLLASMLELEEGKVRLTKLTQNDKDVLAEMSFFEFLVSAIKILSPSVSEIAKRLVSGETFALGNEEEVFNKEFLTGRIKLLKEKSIEIASLLGIEELAKAE